MNALGFFLSATRAIVEMLWLALLGQGLLALIAGTRRESNPLYRLFALINRGPLTLVRACLPRQATPVLTASCCFLLLFILWLGLAALRQHIR